MKPKVNERVWTIFEGQIIAEYVEFLGQDCFLIEGFQDKYDPYFYYEDYNKTWFRDLEKAKKQMRKMYGRNIKIEQYSNDIWEVQLDD